MAKSTKRMMSKKSNKATKGMSKKASKGMAGVEMAYCPTCKKMMRMINPVKVALKGAKSKSVCRLKGTDELGHNTSTFRKC